MVRLRKIFVWMMVLAIILPNAALANGKTDGTGHDLEKRFRKHKGAHKIRIQSVERVDLGRVKDRRMIVKLRDADQLDLEELGYIKVKAPAPLRKRNYKIVRVPESMDYEQALADVRENDAVQYAVPAYYQQIKSVPNDPKYGNQWYLDQIEMPRAWGLPNGTGDVIVAVLDTGVDLDHPDLQGNFITGLEGQDIINGDNKPEDSVGHGTHVSGIIAASTGNSVGVAGIAGQNPYVKIMPVKVSNGDYFPLSMAISGIYYAANHDADIINMSFGGPSYNPAMADAIWFAHERGVVLIAASGNDGVSSPSYPASYIPVVSVSATDRNDERVNQAFWASNWGQWIDVAAPGADIYNTDLSGSAGYSEKSYTSGGGTSYATPIVSGIAALLKSKHSDWGPAKIEWAIEQGAEQSSEWNVNKGYGRVNAFNSLGLASSDFSGGDVPSQRNKAADLQVGTVKSEKIGMPFDQDWYKFGLNTDAEVSIKLSGVTNTLDLGIGVYAPSLKVIDNNGKGSGESYIFAAGPGTHHFTIVDYYNHWSSKPYDVKIRTIPRIHGTNRFETAAAIAEQGWPSANTVILARGYEFPDALAGTPLAHQLDAPILLTRTDKLPNATLAELKRLNANEVILLGGPNAISPNVKDELADMGLNITRINGTSRFQTAVEIADKLEQLTGHQPEKAVVVYGYKFADALTIAAYAARKGYPIFLVRNDEIPQGTKAALAEFDQTIVVGGDGVVGQKVFNQLQKMGCSPVRYAGDNRFETGRKVINQLNLPTGKVFVTRAYKFADALTGSVLAAKNGGSLVLVRQDDVTDPTRRLIRERKLANFSIFGGEGAVNEFVARELLQ